MGYEKADIILYNAAVITCDECNPSADCVAIRGNILLGVGNKYDLDPLIGPETTLIDCQGNTVIPGFNDAHCHPMSYAITKTQIDCSPSAVSSIDGIKAAIREKAKSNDTSSWLRAAKYNETHLAEKRHPTRQDLDEAAPGHPVILTHYTGASCVLNSEAFRRLSITPEIASAEGGIGFDPVTGELNGFVSGLNDRVRKGVPSLSREELMEGIRLAALDYRSHGITSLQDTGWNNGIGHWNTYRSIKAVPGLFPFRVTMLLGYDAIDAAREAGLEMNHGNASLRLGGVKIALDERTRCEHPPQEELEAAALKTIGLGYRAAFHVSNLYQLETSAAALRLALNTYPDQPVRHRLEHCLLCTPDHLPALYNLPVTIVTQAAKMYYQGANFIENIPMESHGCILPLKTFKKAGLTAALSSDSPLMPIDPLLGIYEAMTRKELYGKTIAPDETIPFTEALTMYTLSGAYASGEETIKGSITPGKLADLVILDRDLTRSQAEEVKTTSVLMTIIDGKVVWAK